MGVLAFGGFVEGIYIRHVPPHGVEKKSRVRYGENTPNQPNRGPRITGRRERRGRGRGIRSGGFSVVGERRNEREGIFGGGVCVGIWTQEEGGRAGY